MYNRLEPLEKTVAGQAGDRDAPVPNDRDDFGYGRGYGMRMRSMAERPDESALRTDRMQAHSLFLREGLA